MLADLYVGSHAGGAEKDRAFANGDVRPLHNGRMQNRCEVIALQHVRDACSRLTVAYRQDNGYARLTEQLVDVVVNRHAMNGICREARFHRECAYLMSGFVKCRQYLASQTTGPEDDN